MKRIAVLLSLALASPAPVAAPSLNGNAVWGYSHSASAGRRAGAANRTIGVRRQLGGQRAVVAARRVQLSAGIGRRLGRTAPGRADAAIHSCARLARGTASEQHAALSTPRGRQRYLV